MQRDILAKLPAEMCQLNVIAMNESCLGQNVSFFFSATKQKSLAFKSRARGTFLFGGCGTWLGFMQILLFYFIDIVLSFCNEYANAVFEYLLITTQYSRYYNTYSKEQYSEMVHD